MGIELDEQAIVACVRRGLDVVQADLNKGLSAFADGQFDFVVLSQTLQTVIDVRRVITDMLRVGRRAIVSFPNLGYHKLRRQLAEEGRAPHGLAGRRLPLVQHAQRALPVDRRLRGVLPRRRHPHPRARVPGHRSPPSCDDDPNLNADLAIVVLSR